VDLLGQLALPVPDLLDGGDNRLQCLERIDRFLIKAKNEQLPPMP
jgi:hypothetical protein